MWALRRAATETVIRLVLNLRHPGPLAPIEVFIVCLGCLRPFVCKADLTHQFGPRGVAAACLGLVLLRDILKEVV